MRHWFLGDSVLVRHGDGNDLIRVRGAWPAEKTREYIVEHTRSSVTKLDEHTTRCSVEVVNRAERPTLIEALQLAEQWMP